MSTIATKVAWAFIGQSGDLSAHARLVLLTLADCHIHEIGRCDPSHALLAKRTGLSVDSVKRAINELIRAGAIRRFRRFISVECRPEKNRQTTNAYTFHWARRAARERYRDTFGGGCTQHPGGGAHSPTSRREEEGGHGPSARSDFSRGAAWDWGIGDVHTFLDIEDEEGTR